MLLENCNYACYLTTGSRRWHAELAAGTTTFKSTTNTDAEVDFEGSGAITVAPLDNELYVRL